MKGSMYLPRTRCGSQLFLTVHGLGKTSAWRAQTSSEGRQKTSLIQEHNPSISPIETWSVKSLPELQRPSDVWQPLMIQSIFLIGYFLFYISKVIPFPGFPSISPLSNPPLPSSIKMFPLPNYHSFPPPHPENPLHWGGGQPWQDQGLLFPLVPNKAILCLVSVSMIYLLMRMWCWKFLLLLCEVQCVLWALVRFFHECRCPCIWSLDIQDWEFILVDFFFDEYEVSFLIFLEIFLLKVDFIQY